MKLQIYLDAVPPGSVLANAVVLRSDNWDDYSYKTLFTVTLYTEQGAPISLGSVKIGFTGQGHGRTRETMPSYFEEMPESYFSLGQEPEYYQRLMTVPVVLRNEYLRCMRDVVSDPVREQLAVLESVFSTSLLRSVSRSAIDGQFRRILSGGAVLTSYRFYYTAPMGNAEGAMQLAFEVAPNSLPPTNIHVVIGRNGVGKTTLLNSIVEAIVHQGRPDTRGRFEVAPEMLWLPKEPMPPSYFSSVTSVAFSAFDKFSPLPDQGDASRSVGYVYIGLKKRSPNSPSDHVFKDPVELVDDFLNSLDVCLSMNVKREQWKNAITALEFDENFAEMSLSLMAEDGHNPDEVKRYAKQVFENMSSGHKIVLLTITKLVETVEEKSLVLLDEPESHLHPPLLSAFTRALSELLTARNAVALIATHSPVVLQEVPRSCVWKINRFRDSTKAERPEMETFGENVGALTREIFGLAVSKSGFHDLLAKAVEQVGDFEQILKRYDNQIGLEGQAVLRALIAARG
ncbi:AAA family ATPase [Burkholderia glumae]|uniref:AAA family ATPase n=1 Tax=Burkholderia glumae TaxID=337 RepID=UPI0014628F82|nr:AAA family ATPase [Burkholderia glumae]QJP73794.1 AAA family ATPase [Burkholderia glumae]